MQRNIPRIWLSGAALLLSATMIQPAVAQQAPAVGLVKTVGTDPMACAATTTLQVPVGTTVYYCYAISNTGNVDLTSYDLEDNELGVLISGFAFVLGPGQSFDTVDAGLTFSAAINTTTTNTAVVTAQVDGGGSVFSTAQATVQVGGGSTSAPAPIPTLSVPALALLLLLFAGIGIHRIPRLSRDVSPMTRSH